MGKGGRKELQMGCLSPCYPVIRKYTVKQNSNRKKYLLIKHDAKWAKESFSKNLFLIWILKLNIKSFDSQFYYRMPYLAIKILSKMFYSTVRAGYFKHLVLPLNEEHFANHLKIWFLESPKRAVLLLFLQGH